MYQMHRNLNTASMMSILLLSEFKLFFFSWKKETHTQNCFTAYLKTCLYQISVM